MLIRDALTRPGVAHQPASLEAERQRLARRIGWALRRKDAARAERLEMELARVEEDLARPLRRRPVWHTAGLVGA